MAERQPVAVVLNQVEDLFTAASFAPLQGRFEPRTGMEQVLDQVAVRRLRPGEPLHLRLTLRQSTAADDEAIRAAIRGYCEAVIADQQLDLQRISRSGRNALLLGLGFLAACMALSTAANAATFLPEFIRRLFGEGLVIAGWVGLWRPIEVMLFDTRPPRHDIRLHRAIAAAEIDVLRTA
jgi:hypothetical protein